MLEKSSSRNQCTVVHIKNTKTSTKEKDVVNGQNTALETHARKSNNLVNGLEEKLKEAENVHANGLKDVEENNKNVVVFTENAKEENVKFSKENADGSENLSEQEQSKKVVTGKFTERTLEEKDVVKELSNVFTSKERKLAKKLFTHANGQDLKLKTLNTSVAENLSSSQTLVQLSLSKNVADI